MGTFVFIVMLLLAVAAFVAVMNDFLRPVVDWAYPPSTAPMDDAEIDALLAEFDQVTGEVDGDAGEQAGLKPERDPLAMLRHRQKHSNDPRWRAKLERKRAIRIAMLTHTPGPRRLP